MIFPVKNKKNDKIIYKITEIILDENLKKTLFFQCFISSHEVKIKSKCEKIRNSTTSFLTATTLIYTIGAGITAGAGTRLVLQSFLFKLFTVESFQ